MLTSGKQSLLVCYLFKHLGRKNRPGAFFLFGADQVGLAKLSATSGICKVRAFHRAFLVGDAVFVAYGPVNSCKG